MPFRSPMPHSFQAHSILAHAPPYSGVYGISNAREWIYIGQTDDIRSALLQRLEEAGSYQAQVPTGFTFEVCEPVVRTVRQARLVYEFNPVENRQPDTGSGR